MLNHTISKVEKKLDNKTKLIGCVHYDEDRHATNPREWDNIGKLIVHPNKSHWLGTFKNRSDLLVDLDVPQADNPYSHFDNIRREQLHLKKSDIALFSPITKYEHGNISLSLEWRTGFDYGVIGFVFVTKEQLRKEFGVKKITKDIISRAENTLQAELDALSAWLNGEFYEFAIYKAELDDLGNVTDYDVLDGCCGYLDDEFCKEDMLDSFERVCKEMT